MKAIASFVRLLTLTLAVHVGSGALVSRAAAQSATPAPPPTTASATGEAAEPPPLAASPAATSAPADAKPAADSSSAAPASAAPSSAAPASAAPSSASPTLPEDVDGATYQVRLRDLEARVDELKEKIRQSHTRLSLLSDTILAGAAGGARAEITLENDLSGAWKLIEAVVVLDGAVQYKKTDDTGVLDAQKKIPIFTGSIPSGDHVVQVMLKLRGHGFGVFSYLRGIEATVRNDYSFTINDGKLIELRAVAWEQGGPTTPVEDQPTIRFVENLRAVGDVPRAATPPASPAAPAPAAPAPAAPASSAPKPAAPPVPEAPAPAASASGGAAVGGTVPAKVTSP